MLELYIPNYEVLNTKERVTVDLIKDGKEFLEQHEINPDFLLDTISLVYRFLKVQDKIPHNLYKFFMAAYYIVTRHPFAFPAHEKKKDFCAKFNCEMSSLEYCVDKITKTLDYIKILDDMNFPYYIDIERDLSLKVIKTIVKTRVDEEMMKFLLFNKPVNSQLLTEELVSDIIFEHKAFPEELFRQLFDIVFRFVESEFADYNEYVKLQQHFFV